MLRFIKSLLLSFLVIAHFCVQAQNKTTGSIFDKADKVTKNAKKYLDRAKDIFDKVENSDVYKKLVNGEKVDLPIPIPYNFRASIGIMKSKNLIIKKARRLTLLFL